MSLDLVAVVGPTASGKTELGAALAERFGGEVVSADAFAVYRGLDIGTAKPEGDLRRRIPHHLVDVADPRERYSAGAFERDAREAVTKITGRGRLPVVVGGTLFYVRTLLYGLFPEPPKDPALRRELERAWEHDAEGVRSRLALLDPEAMGRIEPNDRQRILRALEVSLVAGEPMTRMWRRHPTREPRYRALVLALRTPRPLLHARIAARVVDMFDRGLVDETRRLLAAGVHPDAHAFKAIGYRESIRVIREGWTVDEAIVATTTATRQLAKRQLTWLRGEPGVSWLDGPGGASSVGEAAHRVEVGLGERD